MKILIFLASFFFLISTSLSAQRVFEQNGKFGLKGNDSTLLLKPEYEQINLCYSIGDINTSFQIRINNDFDDFFGDEDFGEGDLEEDLDSFSEIEGRTPPKYVTVQANGKRGLFKLDNDRKELEEILPVKFSSFQVFGEKIRVNLGRPHQLFLLQKEGKWAMFSPENQKLKKANYQFDSLYLQTEVNNWVLAKKAGKWGFIDRRNPNLKVNYIYPQKPDFRFKNTYSVETLPNKDYRCVIVTKKGNSINTTEYLNLSGSKLDALIGQKNGSWGIVHTSGAVLLPFEYDKITFNNRTRVFKLLKNEKIGMAFFAESGYSETLNHYPIELRVPAEFDKIKKLETVYLVQKATLLGAYSQKGQLILPVEYDKVEKIYRESKFIVTKSGKEGVVSYTEKAGKYEIQTLLPIEYEKLQLGYSLKGGFIAKKEGKYGILNPDYSIVLPVEYDSLIPYPRFFLKKDGKWGRMKEVGV
ncbi:MAG: hypothetical protein ACJAWV_002412 [Flammeovirgaceae bacterium]|jgi:hypothetical protein